MVIEVIFDDEPTLTTLLQIVAFMTLLWGAIFTTLTPIISHLIRNRPWLRESSDRDYIRDAKDTYKAVGMDFTKDEFFEFTVQTWPLMQLVILQHLVGGSLCLPSIFGWFDESTFSSLACLGILSEVGWEMQDTITMFYKRFFKPNGDKLISTTFMAILLLHHSLATSLGIPLILYYRNFKVLHWICFDLQAAGAIAMGVGEYTKLLDISIPSQLIQFQVLTFFALIVLIWTRVIHWFYLMGQFMMVWYNEKAWSLLIVGTIVCAFFTFFSVIAGVVPYYKRFMKFLKVKATHESLPDDVDESTMRKSLHNLHASAAEIHKPFNADDLMALFENTSEVTMRQTMPPSSAFRRSSRMLLNSSEMRYAMGRRASYQDLKKEKVN